MIEELETTLDWIAIRTAAVEDLTERLAFAQEQDPPRLDEIRSLRRQLERVKNWNPLLHVPGRK